MEVAKRIYIGNGDEGVKRLQNIRKLADMHFHGSVSALFNDAINKLYGMDPKTGAFTAGKAKR